MPTNLPPEYFEAEERYRAATSIRAKISCLEDLISTVPKHKGTDRLRADLRRRLAKLRAAPQARKGVGRHDSAFHIDKEGAGQVAIVGTANVGKSALLAALTHATPEVAERPYTTWTPTPGMMPVKDVQIQLVDTPSLNRDFVRPELLDLIRRADIVLLVLDLQAYPLQQLEETVAILEEHRIVPRHLRERYADPQRLTFVPTLLLVSKHDDQTMDDDMYVLSELLQDDWPLLSASAATGRNLERLKRALFDRLDVIRVYSRPPGEKADLSAPFVLKRGSTVEELAAKVHRDFYDKLKSARVWGRGVRQGQMVSRDYVLLDGDVIELRI